MTQSSAPLLTLNIGSSSIKYALFDPRTLSELGRGKEERHPEDNEAALEVLLDNLPKPSLIAHRIVHGADFYTRPILLDDDVLNKLESLVPFAPLHQPHNLNGARLTRRLRPEVLQYGCFDTAFHARHSPLYSSFALPESYNLKGLKRYGFHGLSYEWISRHVRAPRVVIAHLGSGASLCALKEGESIDTTMGLTALDGLPMATRSGSIDAGLVLYLARELGYSADQIEHLLYLDSGLKGLSGISGDVRTLLDSADPRAKFALDYFVLKTAQHIAMMATSLGGMDLLVFTGGIGENALPLRQAIIDRLYFMPSFEVEVIPTNEEKMMAIQVLEGFANA